MVIQKEAMILLWKNSRKQSTQNSYMEHPRQKKIESHRNRITYQTYHTSHGSS